VADAFDSLTTSRSHRDAHTVEEAVAELHRRAGAQFDPSIVGALERGLTRRVWEPTQLAPRLMVTAGVAFDHDDPTASDLMAELAGLVPVSPVLVTPELVSPVLVTPELVRPAYHGVGPAGEEAPCAEIVRQTGVLDNVAVILEAQTTPYEQVRQFGADLPLSSRIIKVCNAYDDLAGSNPGSARRNTAIERIHLGLGYEYDPPGGRCLGPGACPPRPVGDGRCAPGTSRQRLGGLGTPRLLCQDDLTFAKSASCAHHSPR
jgi:hypothetical protein